MRRLLIATILGLGLLSGTAAMTSGRAGPALPAASAVSAEGLGTVVPVQYRPYYRPPHYAPPRYAPPRRGYRQHYAPPPRPYYRQRYLPPPRPHAPPPRAYYRR